MRLLKEKGVIIFDDYLWEKLEPSLFTPKPAIDSVLEIYKDVIDILYVGYQVIIQKVPPKFSARKTVRTVISGFSDLLNKFWKENSARVLLSLEHNPLSELRFSFQEKTAETSLQKKIYSLPTEIVTVYTVNDFKEIKQNIEAKLGKNRLIYFFEYNIFSIRNLIAQSVVDKKAITLEKSTIHLFPPSNFVYMDNYVKKLNVKFFKKQVHETIPINIYEAEVFDYQKVKAFLEFCATVKQVKQVNGMASLIMSYNQLYERNILVNVLSLNFLLKKNGDFSLILDGRVRIMNDFLRLLSGLFTKTNLYFIPYKMSTYITRISCTNFQGIPISIYDGILKRLSLNKDMEIVSLFKNSQQIWGFEENPQLKTILKEYDENKDIILNHLDKFRILQTRRTLDDLYTYVLK